MFPQTVSLQKGMKTRQHRAELRPSVLLIPQAHIPSIRRKLSKQKIKSLGSRRLPQAMKKYFTSNPNFFLQLEVTLLCNLRYSVCVLVQTRVNIGAVISKRSRHGTKSRNLHAWKMPNCNKMKNTVKKTKREEDASLPCSYLRNIPVRTLELFPKLASVSRSQEEKSNVETKLQAT